MLCERADAKDLAKYEKEYACETKLDGTRAFIIKDADGKISIIGRKRANGHQSNYAVEHNLPEVEAIANALPPDSWLDNELVAFDENGRVNRTLCQRRCSTTSAWKVSALSRQIPVYAYAFDVLRIGGKDLTKVPYFKRKEQLKGLVESLKLQRLLYLPFALRGFKEMFDKEQEGVVLKKIWSPYIPKRCSYWVKVKKMADEIVTVVGFTNGEGKCEGLFGSLVCVDDEGKYVCNVGGGFTDAERQQLTAILRKLEHPLHPRYISEVGDPYTPVKDCPFKLVLTYQEKTELGHRFAPRMKTIKYT